MPVSRELLVAIADAVHSAAGGMDNVEDLARTWERLESATQARIDRMRYEARTIRCSCGDGGLVEDSRRCRGCYGTLQARR